LNAKQRAKALDGVDGVSNAANEVEALAMLKATRRDVRLESAIRS
jgi:hypothetical protein